MLLWTGAGFAFCLLKTKGWLGAPAWTIFSLSFQKNSKARVEYFPSFSGYSNWYLVKTSGTAKAPKKQLIAVAFIFAGAVGNIIDSVFYGVLFSDSIGQVATFLPEGGGYAPLMFGHVVDMFQFPMFTWVWPDWLPFVGGTSFTFFEPVFNVADSAISVGVALLLIQQRKSANR